MKLNLVFRILVAAFALAACEEFGNSLLEMKIDPRSTQTEKTSDELESNQLADNVLEIFEDSQGNIWFGTTEGVARLNNIQNQAGVQDDLVDYFSKEDGLCGNTVGNIIEDGHGAMWFGTHSDMCRIDISSKGKDNSIEFMQFERNDTVPKLGWGWKNVKKDRNGDIWVNTHQGIFRYQNDEFVEFKVPVSTNLKPSFCNTPGDVAMYLVDSKGNIWFGTDGDGAYKYNPSANQNGQSAFTHFTKEDGLSSNFVNGIIEDHTGHIWFTCAQDLNNPQGDGGLSRLDMNTTNKVNTNALFTNFPNLKGLYSNNINTIYEDKNGNIWIGATGVGVYRYDINSNGVEDDRFKLFMEPHGISTKPGAYTAGLQSILEDSKGRLWCGFSGGLYLLKDHQRKEVGNGDYFVNVTKDGPWL